MTISVDEDLVVVTSPVVVAVEVVEVNGNEVVVVVVVDVDVAGGVVVVVVVDVDDVEEVVVVDVVEVVDSIVMGSCLKSATFKMFVAYIFTLVDTELEY